MTLVDYLTQDLSEETKKAVLESFAGYKCRDTEYLGRYLEYYRTEIGRTAAILDDSLPLSTGEDVINLFNQVKCRAWTNKADIDPQQKNRTGLDVVVRAMLVTACRSPEVSGGDNYDPAWVPDESIEAYINRVYPKSALSTIDSGLERINAGRFAASSLSDIARIKIEWTDCLTNHLNLFIGNDWKTLYLFRHPRYLKMCLEGLAPYITQGVEMTAGQSLKQNNYLPFFSILKSILTNRRNIPSGCLPPSLLQETLDTYDLFFPLSDRSSRRILERHVEDRSKRLDGGLLDPFSISTGPHWVRRDAASLADLQSLYVRFPHWNQRIHRLWSELENPTAITRWEKWSDKRKSAWYATWWGVLGIAMALIFGCASILLGALQVWISYCSWIDDDSVVGCGLKARLLSSRPTQSP
ncbi:hypothetical protein jhhlp_004816 [Lomentospora prolificans]|uniref:Uncharacterized protein n=1 Tax=Lomentospora prolificans TaxID=41688 RepID=A0A2N3N8J0_9PEZI|nr:hypothetical protein jhhlp_004816 [Lomentospora prolificans]